MISPFTRDVRPDWQGFVNCILRKGTPDRVYFIELFLDGEVQQAVCDRYGLEKGLDKNDPAFPQRRQIALQRFLGYDYVRCGVENMAMPVTRIKTDDTAGMAREGGRSFMEEHKGPITTWEEFEKYPWPDPAQLATAGLEWYEKNLPDDMCVIGMSGFAHFAEYLTWLMGYESLCYALYEQRDLVAAMYERILKSQRVVARSLAQFSRVKVLWGSDDMGFKTGPMISPADLREFALPGHKAMAEIAHAAGKLYPLHSCGKIESIMPDLINDVRIDAIHSFEDTIISVVDAKARYGDRIAVLGGIDVDFLCRSDEKQVRRRVRETLKKCQPGGGYCLGTGNSVANYIPLDNYLAMLDEGRRFAG